ncbi:SDR family NAD(P)-dependent oxidoreductase [Cryobacterium tagatosivorans]|uniref:SDR family oxidoreductase n=1 Tax=Cryobacterium tagatosivorans TaxID=1259199 RepID=A0A4R8UB65_9MICO|nr:SDR family oxidoreductase [Cryobacterium tagatosivorans]TFB46722.1 SDR family oxidoreductase [Cryobacterium tagatosivorans]
MIISNKVFVVTGGGNGIGRDVVLALVRKGARVAAVDLSEAGLAETMSLAGAFGDHVSSHVVNIADRAAVEALPDAVMEAHGAVDGLVNVAGIIHRFARVNDLTFDEIDKVMNVNFYGVLNMTKTFLPHLLKRPEGHIATVSSMGAFVPVPGQTAYGASKAAVKLLMEGLNSELLDTNVRVTVAFPGAVGTNIAVNSGAMTVEQSKQPSTMKIKMTPSPLAADLVVRAIEKKSYHAFIGSDSKMMDKLSRIMPERAAKIIYSQMRSLLSN